MVTQASPAFPPLWQTTVGLTVNTLAAATLPID